MFEIRRYTPDDAEAWNDYVANSKNGTFLFDRNYMDYHSDRFEDCSLMLFRDDKLHALLPANINGDTLQSHMGLTYGGLIMNETVTAAATVQLFNELNIFLKSNNIRHVVYKCIPYIYQSMPSDEDLYALFRTCNAKLCARDISSCIAMDSKPKWFHNRKRFARKAIKENIKVIESNDLSSFWTILTDNLTNKYGVKPVHNLREIEMLQSKFPDNIRLFLSIYDDKPVGGTLCISTST